MHWLKENSHRLQWDEKGIVIHWIEVNDELISLLKANDFCTIKEVIRGGSFHETFCYIRFGRGKYSTLFNIRLEKAKQECIRKESEGFKLSWRYDYKIEVND